jgi:hypothetical protein
MIETIDVAAGRHFDNDVAATEGANKAGSDLSFSAARPFMDRSL